MHMAPVHFGMFVSGRVKPGQILAILGPSGCGKTTLLNILAHRLAGYKGGVRVNGHDIHTVKHMKRKIAYVTQDDLLLPTLTVQENLDFTAELRLPKDQFNRVGELIHLLDLDKCSNSYIGGSQMNLFGNQVRGVSGGERKRANIANELLTNPSVVILDEPTSGLDATAAYSLFTNLKNLASHRKTVIVTLHQPSSLIFAAFDQLLVMSEGRSLYYGPASDSVEYFSELGFRCPVHYNPADYFLDLARGDHKHLADSRSLEKYKPLPVQEGKLPTHQEFTTGWWHQFTTLYRRQLLLTLSNVSPFAFVPIMIIAAFIGVLWFRLHQNDSNVLTKNGAIFLGLVFAVGFAPMSVAVSQFPTERPNLIKERHSGSYHVSAYYVAKRCAEIPIETIYPLLYTTIVYWMVGFRADVYFLLHLSIMLMMNYASSALGLAISATISNLQLAIGAQTVIGLLFAITSGFYIPIYKLPSWMRWISWIPYYRYAYEAIIFTEYRNRNITHITSAGFLSQQQLSALGNSTHVPPSMVFHALGLRTSLQSSLAALGGFLVLFNVLAILALYLFVKK